MHESDKELVVNAILDGAPGKLKERLLASAHRDVEALEPAIDALIERHANDARELERARAEKLLEALEDQFGAQSDRFSEAALSSASTHGDYKRAVSMEKCATYMACSIQVMEMRRVLMLRRARKMIPYGYLPPARPDAREPAVSGTTGLLNLLTPRDLYFELDKDRFVARAEVLTALALSILKAEHDFYGCDFSSGEVSLMLRMLGYVDAALSQGVKQ